jgi:DNA-binding FadR family transcriptional regulator
VAQLTAPVRSSLSAQVADQIVEMISSGEWATGTRIPPEYELAGRLGVSRNTVREALRALAHAGMLRSRPGDGTYVAASSELEASLARRARRADRTEVFEVRAALEQSAARLAAQRRSAADVRQLRQLLAAKTAVGPAQDADGYLRADLALHKAVVRCARNSLLADIYENIAAVIADSIRGSLDDPVRVAGQDERHAELVEAIAAGDALAAGEAAGRIVGVPVPSRRNRSHARAAAR